MTIREMWSFIVEPMKQLDNIYRCGCCVQYPLKFEHMVLIKNDITMETVGRYSEHDISRADNEKQYAVKRVFVSVTDLDEDTYDVIVYVM